MVSMHPNRTPVYAGDSEAAYAADTISRVPNQPKTPNRAIRIDDELWRDYGDACEKEGTTRSEDLRAHMVRKVKAWRKTKGRDGERA